MKCSRCGNTINDDITQCPNCGNNFDEEKIDELLESNKEISISKIIMAVILVLLFVVSIYYIIVGLRNDLTVVGKWKCADYSENINTKDKNIYYFNLEFLDNNSFKQYSLNNSNNSFEINGIYSEEISDKYSEDMYGYLDVYLGTKTITKNGVTSDSEITNHYEFCLMKNRKNALVINTQSYSVYYCERD